MNVADNKINLFTTRIRQLILQYGKLRAENTELYEMVDERDKRIAELEKQLAAANTEAKKLRAARLLEVADGDVETARRRVATLIRSVNKCITLLSEK